MRPRRLRSSMNRVVIMAPWGSRGDPRWSRVPVGRVWVRYAHVGRHWASPSRLVTCRNHDSSEAWITWSRYTEIPPSTSTRLISAITSRPVPAGKVTPSPVPRR